VREKMQVEAICDGTVIDHIPARMGQRILQHLSLTDTDNPMTMGFNLPSKTQGRKDIIKIENRHFTQAEANELAFFAPGATINVIASYEVIDKIQVQVPDRLEQVFDCPNSNCVTQNEPVTTSFRVLQVEGGLHLRCKYCERVFNGELFR
jgi:aspartate carbamoyltransferase regulatory subunit